MAGYSALAFNGERAAGSVFKLAGAVMKLLA